jgi:hypothetical protein
VATIDLGIAKSERTFSIASATDFMRKRAFFICYLLDLLDF